jgi:hypothetical protein
MKEELVAFDTAVLAKEKGFDELCDHYFVHKFGNSFERLHGQLFAREVKNEDDCVIGFRKHKNSKGQPHIIIAPTQSLLQRWLREKHKIIVSIIPTGGPHDTPFYPWNDIEQNEIFFAFITHDIIGKAGMSDGYFNTYEEALEQGLLEALKLIK